MSTQELIERIQTFSFYRSRLGSSGEKLLKEAAQALTASQERERVLREAVLDCLASLVASTSLLERGGKKAASSDKMFAQMLKDYEASIERARQALQSTEQQG